MSIEKKTALFFKNYHSILKLKLTDKRKMILCALMSTYERFFTEKLEYKGIKYHFYISQKELYSALGMAQRTFEYNLKWLKEKKYINFEAANKPGYLCPTTYFFINSNIINLVIPQEKEEKEENKESEEGKNSKNTEKEEKEIKISTKTIDILSETIEEVSISTENDTISMETEKQVNCIVVFLLQWIKSSLDRWNEIEKSSFDKFKNELIGTYGIDTVEKAMSKCLEDEWFKLVDSGDSGEWYKITNDDMLKNITVEELEELKYNYNEIYGLTTDLDHV